MKTSSENLKSTDIQVIFMNRCVQERLRFMTLLCLGTNMFDGSEVYLPENGVYCVSQETFSRFRRQEFGAENRHKLFKVDLSVTWSQKAKRKTLTLETLKSEQARHFHSF